MGKPHSSFQFSPVMLCKELRVVSQVEDECEGIGSDGRRKGRSGDLCPDTSVPHRIATPRGIRVLQRGILFTCARVIL